MVQRLLLIKYPTIKIVGFTARFIKKNKTKVCANCGKEIEGNYLKIGDNFLQIKYFDDEETENVFCDQTCLCEALSVLEIDEEG